MIALLIACLVPLSHRCDGDHELFLGDVHYPEVLAECLGNNRWSKEPTCSGKVQFDILSQC